MCGGRSLHKDDWLKLGIGVGTAAAGFGAAGMGPLAGLLGGASASATPILGASGLAEMATAGAATPGIEGLIAGGASAGKTLSALEKANLLMKLAAGPGQQPMQMPMSQQPQRQVPQSDNQALLDAIWKRYGG